MGVPCARYRARAHGGPVCTVQAHAHGVFRNFDMSGFLNTGLSVYSYPYFTKHSVYISEYAARKVLSLWKGYMWSTCTKREARRTNQKRKETTHHTSETNTDTTLKRGRWPRPPCLSLLGMAPRRYEPWAQDQYSSLKHKYHLKWLM